MFLEVLESLNLERDLRFAIANLVLDTHYAETWAWITGRSTDAQSRKINMLSNPKDETAALEVISGLLDFLSVRFKFVSICIDELENLKGKSRNAQSIREGLRDLYDMLLLRESDLGIILFMAATATVWAEITDTLRGALSDRIDENINLASLSTEDAKYFVKDLFSNFRDGQSDEVCPPFDNESAFTHFIEVSSKEVPDYDNREMGKTGTPRRIVKLGKKLFRRSCAKGLEEIDKETIDSILLGKEGS